MDLIEQIATNFCTATWLTWENACGLFSKLLTNESFSIARANSFFKGCEFMVFSPGVCAESQLSSTRR